MDTKKSVLSRPPTSSQSRNCWKPVLLRPSHLPKVEIVQNQPLQGQCTLYKNSTSWETWTMNVQTRAFPSVTKELPFQDNLQSKPTVLTQWALSSRRCFVCWRPKWMYRAFPSVIDKWTFQDHLSSITTMTERALPPSRWSVSQEAWIMNVQSRIFHSVTEKWHFQDHLLIKPIISTCWALPPGRLPSVANKQCFQDHYTCWAISQETSSMTVS